ncbi:MAG: acyl-CoA dehydrogenase [Bradyrhizobium sp.]|nr:acyl-CoA dehydrogenase [Bradyrhizobium sp.]
MNFLLSDEQEALYDTVLRFAQGQVATGALRGAIDGTSDLIEPCWRGLIALGVAGLTVPEQDGGVGLELIDLALVAEALGGTALPGPFLGHVLAIEAVTRAGSDAQKARWLPGLIAGDVVAAIALDGPEPERWALDISAGTLSGRGRDIIGGASADVIVVGLKNGRFALVPAGQGVTVTALDGADRTRRIADIAFDQAPATLLEGEDAAASVIDTALVLLAADAFGGARRCLDMAADYARSREQFGQLIGQFQGLKFQIADMAVEIEPARGLYWYAAHAHDHVPADARRMAAMAKAHLGDVYMQAARANIEAHGGIGYTWEHDAQIFFKRAMLDFTWLGTPGEHRDRQARLSAWSMTRGEARA